MFSVSTGPTTRRECQDLKGDTEDPSDGNERDFTEALPQFGKIIT